MVAKTFEVRDSKGRVLGRETCGDAESALYFFAKRARYATEGDNYNVTLEKLARVCPRATATEVAEAPKAADKFSVSWTNKAGKSVLRTFPTIGAARAFARAARDTRGNSNVRLRHCDAAPPSYSWATLEGSGFRSAEEEHWATAADECGEKAAMRREAAREARMHAASDEADAKEEAARWAASAAAG